MNYADRGLQFIQHDVQVIKFNLVIYINFTSQRHTFICWKTLKVYLAFKLEFSICSWSKQCNNPAGNNCGVKSTIECFPLPTLMVRILPQIEHALNSQKSFSDQFVISNYDPWWTGGHGGVGVVLHHMLCWRVWSPTLYNAPYGGSATEGP